MTIYSGCKYLKDYPVPRLHLDFHVCVCLNQGLTYIYHMMLLRSFLFTFKVFTEVKIQVEVFWAVTP